MKRKAILIGVNSYANGIKPLSCAKKDAEELRISFNSAGFETDILTNEEASGADVVRARIRDFTSGLGRGDLFLLYFAGHGVFNSGRQLLLCANASYAACAEWKRKGGKTLPVGAIALDDIASDTVGECDRVFLFDMCRTPLQDGARGAAPMAAARDLAFVKPRSACNSNWTYFFSCDEGQPALEVEAAQRGLFSLALSKVLNDRLSHGRRLLLDEGFVGAMEAEMRNVAETYGMDSCGQRPHRDPHGDTIALFDPAWDSGNAVHAPAFPMPPLHSPKPRRRRGWGRLAFTCAASLAALAALGWLARECFGPIGSLWHPSRESLSAEEQYERALFFSKRRLFSQRNRQRALEWYRASAESGSAEGQFEMGRILRNGEGGQIRNEFEAVEWFRKAAEQGHAGALAEMGRYYLLGTAGVRKDEEKAIECFRRSADKGDWLGMMLLGIAYQHGSGGLEADPERAEILLRRAAGHGGARGKYELADFLLDTVAEKRPGCIPEAISLLREAAEGKDTSALREYGRILLFGLHGVAADVARGMSCLREAANADDEQAKYLLARCLLGAEDVAVPRDGEEGISLLREAAFAGDIIAQTWLGDILMDGEYGQQADPVEAAKWYRKAAKQGDAYAQFCLGACCEDGRGIPLNYEEAVKWFRLAADQGFAYAQFSLGACHYGGKGVPQDYAEAVKWFRLAADQGHAPAQFCLGACYANGRGVPQDHKEAVKWFRMAADQGFAVAQFNLGVYYADGIGVPQDYAEAVKWYRLAADQGLADAQLTLGACYENGHGVPQDYEEAAKWYRLAADQGLAEAQYNLGRCYANGEGVPQDYAEAVKWFRMAAGKGNATAQYNLGLCYENGCGVPQDYAEAVKWHRMAANQEHENATKALARLGARS